MPRITISINAPNEPSDQELLTLDLPPGLTVKDLKSFVQSETDFPVRSQQFYLNGRPLNTDTQTLEEAGVNDGEMLAMLIRKPGTGAQGQGGRGTGRAGNAAGADGRRRGDVNQEELETVRLRVLGDPAAIANLNEQNPELASALNDPARFRDLFLAMRRQEDERERERQNQIALLNEDPFNVEAQRKIEEMIRQDRVIENLQHAYENNPEVFARVTMLYINAEVNGHPVKAFVDSGAQATIMSPSCAEACGIMRLIDTRYSGVAKGVGTAKILGRVHHAEIKIGDALMPCAFTVMEGKDVDLLFGLDMLKRYKAKIDLDKNALCFQGIEVPFLPESEIPKNLEEAELNEPTVSGPNGTEIGAKSGAVRPAGTAAAAGSSAAGSSSASSNFQGAGQTVGPAAPGTLQTQTTIAGAATNFPQASIEQLQNLGFSREDAIRALRATNGNVEYAAGLLFSNMNE